MGSAPHELEIYDSNYVDGNDQMETEGNGGEGRGHVI